MLQVAESYETLIARFRWNLPERFNIGVACADRWAHEDAGRLALIRRHADGSSSAVSFGDLAVASNRLAHALRRRGVGPGDRVAVVLPQSPETVAVHFAVYKLGAIAVPLAVLFGTDALAYRLRAAGVRALVTHGEGLEKVRAIRAGLPALETVLCLDGPADGAEGYHEAVAREAPDFQAYPTGPDDPALMIFTSGTTGPPKGALHGHRVLLGHLPGFAFSHEFLPQAGDRLWTPADWAWAGGLLNCLLPGLYHGVPVVAGPFRRFDPEEAFALIAETGVRNAFIPPTALKMMRSVKEPRRSFALDLRTVVAAGEALGREAYDWARDALGLTVNEVYGQTECNYVLASCAALGVSRAGSIGKAAPGHAVAVIDPEDGRVLPADTLGQIAVRRPDPVMFLGYWENEAATREKFVGDWMLTGDQGMADADGYVRFVGRDDDVIISAAYRIGPGEIEDCLIGHPAVKLAAAVGKPDPVRTEIVKAFVVLKDGVERSAALADDIRDFVRNRLSAAEYPREIAFVDEMPLTTTGKVIRRHFREQARQEAAAAGGGPAPSPLVGEGWGGG